MNRLVSLPGRRITGLTDSMKYSGLSGKVKFEWRNPINKYELSEFCVFTKPHMVSVNKKLF